MQVRRIPSQMPPDLLRINWMSLRNLKKSCRDVREAQPHEMQFFLLWRGKAKMVQAGR